MSVIDKAKILLGTGEGANYADCRLNEMLTKSGEEAQLYRVMCKAEYHSIKGNKFSHYDWAMEMKWFATCYEHSKKWQAIFYPSGDGIIIEIVVLKEALLYMFQERSLDNIGAAYAADVELLNMVVRSVKVI